MESTLVVAAAGDGTRMRARTPKALVPVGNSTLIEVSTRALAFLCDEAVLVVKSDAVGMFRSALCSLHGLPITYVAQDVARGTADAVIRGLDLVDTEWSIIVWADHVGASFANPDHLANILVDQSLDGIVPVVWKDQPYAYFQLDGKMKIQHFFETRRGDPTVTHGWSDCGFFLFRTQTVREAIRTMIDESVMDQNLLSLFPKFEEFGLNIGTIEYSDARLTLGVNTPEEISRVANEVPEIES